MAARTQRKRTAGWRRGSSVIVDRTSRYGNPFVIVDDRDRSRPEHRALRRPSLAVQRS